MGLPVPILIGAGIGAVGSAMSGQSPIKGALMGGALGGIGSAFMPAAAAATSVAPLAGGTIPLALSEGAMFAPIAAEAGVGAGGILSAATPGVFETAALGGTSLAPYAGAGGGLAAAGGSALNAAPGITNLSQYATGANTLGLMAPQETFMGNLKDYMSKPDNLQGLSKLAQDEERSDAPMQAPPGRLQPGQAVTSDAISGLLQSIKPQERKQLYNLFG